MKNKTKKLLLIIFITLFSIISLSLFDISSANATSIFNILGNSFRGAQLYDNWMAVLDVSAPDGNSPFWYLQDTNKVEGADTWRCQECHGWDYKGNQGAFANGNHVTGFIGIQNMIGKSNEEIINYLNGTNNIEHDFSAYLSEKDMNDLAAFMQTKQVDLELLVNYDTREILGHKENGQVYYQETCQECHGEFGSDIIVSHDGFMMYISDLAYADPWQAIHHTRFGKPIIENNHAFEEYGLSIYKITDILAYVQSLPTYNTKEQLQKYNPILTIDTSNQGKIDSILFIGIILLVFIIISWFIISLELKKQETKMALKPNKK